MCEIGSFTTLDKVPLNSGFVFVFLNGSIFTPNISLFLVYEKTANDKVVAIFTRFEFDIGKIYPANSIVKRHTKVLAEVDARIFVIGNRNSSRRVVREISLEPLPKFKNYE